MDYDLEPDENDHVITVAAFRAACRTRTFVDYDGYGHPMKHGAICEAIIIRPSNHTQIPYDATHIVWYNR